MRSYSEIVEAIDELDNDITEFENCLNRDSKSLTLNEIVTLRQARYDCFIMIHILNWVLEKEDLKFKEVLGYVKK
jgi:hypothetical protein